MGGIRLHHPTLAGLTAVVELGLPWDRSDKKCNLCGVPHQTKSIHLRIDPQGDVIVSRSVFEALQKIPGMWGFEVANEVPEPPTQVVGVVERPKTYLVDLPRNGDRKRASKYIPKMDKYKSRDVMVASLKRAGIIVKEPEDG